MPQVIALVLAGAGIFAGYRWLSREVRRAIATADDEINSQAVKSSRMPKDLGSLEWDEKAGVYRPVRQV